MATVESPPTIPAVYQAALISRGPPKKASGATTAPMTPSQRNTKPVRFGTALVKTPPAKTMFQAMTQTNPFNMTEHQRTCQFITLPSR